MRIFVFMMFFLVCHISVAAVTSVVSGTLDVYDQFWSEFIGTRRVMVWIPEGVIYRARA